MNLAPKPSSDSGSLIGAPFDHNVFEPYNARGIAKTTAQSSPWSRHMVIAAIGENRSMVRQSSHQNRREKTPPIKLTASRRRAGIHRTFEKQSLKKKLLERFSGDQINVLSIQLQEVDHFWLY